MSQLLATAPKLAQIPSANQLTALFRGLADPARLSVLRRLVEAGPQRVSELVGVEGLRQPSISKHLACLHECGLVARERRGRQVIYSVIRPEVPSLISAAEGLWEIARCGENCACDCCREGGER